MTILKYYYLILEIPQSASIEDIRKSYRRLALKWHPDKNQSFDAHERFIEIKEAYDILSNVEKRSKYDLMLNFEKNKNKEEKYSTDKFKDKMNQDFSKWQEKSRKEAMQQAKMSFDTFSTSLSKIFEGAKNGFVFIFTIIIFIYIGPYGMFKMLEWFLANSNKFYKLPILNEIVLIIFFLFSFSFTIRVLYVHLKN